jgi:hypothetical protein
VNCNPKFQKYKNIKYGVIIIECIWYNGIDKIIRNLNIFGGEYENLVNHEGLNSLVK